MKLVVSFLMIPIIFGFAGCASEETQPEQPPIVAPVAVSEMNSGLDALEKAEYQSALDSFNGYLAKNPISQNTPNVTFYIGLCLEGLGRFEEAESKFRATMRLVQDRDSYLTAEALYHLARSYEGQGDDPKALATLLDTERRVKFLRREVGEVELPARIAAIYARQNQLEMADKFYSKADLGLKRLMGKGAAQAVEWIPRALYSMGKMSPRTLGEGDFDNGLKSLRRSQNYLMRAVDLSHRVWSKKAEEEIESIYSGAWKTIENLPLEETEDRLMALKKQQGRMIDMGLALNGALTALKQDFVPGREASNPHQRKLIAFLDSFEKRLDSLITSRPVQEGLTPEAQRLDGVIREGRVVDPEANLEKAPRPKQKPLPKKKSHE